VKNVEGERKLEDPENKTDSSNHFDFRLFSLKTKRGFESNAEPAHTKDL
jgi:hypothetical protein